MKPNSYKEVSDYQSSDVMGQPLGKGEGAKKTFADLTQSLDVSASPFQLPSPLVFPLLARPEVGKLSAASPSLPITLSPRRGSHLRRLVLGADSFLWVSKYRTAQRAGVRRISCQQFILPVGPVFSSPVLTASCTEQQPWSLNNGRGRKPQRN